MAYWLYLAFIKTRFARLSADLYRFLSREILPVLRLVVLIIMAHFTCLTFFILIHLGLIVNLFD